MQTIQTRCTEARFGIAFFSRWARPFRSRRRNILQLEFPPEDKERMQELAAKARDGSLSAAEQEVIRNYERVGNLLGIIKAKARQRLKGEARSNGSDG